jgi:hypothetical protein
MAVGITSEVEGMTAEIYDALNAEMNFPQDVPDGLISHLAGPTDAGFRIVDVWESREQFDDFIENRLMPAVGNIEGGSDISPSPPQEFPIHNEFRA